MQNKTENSQYFYQALLRVLMLTSLFTSKYVIACPNHKMHIDTDSNQPPAVIRANIDFATENLQLAQSQYLSSEEGFSYCRPLWQEEWESVGWGELGFTIGWHSGLDTIGTEWEVASAFGICFNGPALSDEKIEIRIESPSGQVWFVKAYGNRPMLHWTIEPNDPPGLYKVTSDSLPGVESSFSVKSTAEKPQISAVDRFSGTYFQTVQEGMEAKFYLSGYQNSSNQFYICKLTEYELEAENCWLLQNIVLGESRHATVIFSTKGLRPGKYFVTDESLEYSDHHPRTINIVSVEK